jgi:hypothetical protein
MRPRETATIPQELIHDHKAPILQIQQPEQVPIPTQATEEAVTTHQVEAPTILALTLIAEDPLTAEAQVQIVAEAADHLQEVEAEEVDNNSIPNL